MEIITSKSNEKVKFIKSLNEKKFRQKYECFYLEGVKVVEEVISSNRAINILFIAYSDEILSMINGGNRLLSTIQVMENNDEISILNISAEVFETLTDTVNTQGVLVVLKMFDYDLIESLQNEKDLILLDKVQDAGNLGTIVRTCDAFHIKTILCMEGTVDVYSPKVLRSTMGSILRQKVIYINEENISNLKKYGHKLIGTSLATNNKLKEMNLDLKKIFVFGNEANGISKLLESNCDELIKIEMSDSAESLNVGISTGIVLYENYMRKYN
ncbi:MAG: RNA methyltransferase [Clostridia bacterium]|nr:RNA methyltransferase [Clostridia bacterium]